MSKKKKKKKKKRWTNREFRRVHGRLAILSMLKVRVVDLEYS